MDAFVSGSRFSVVASAAVLALVGVLRLGNFWVTGHDDQALQQAFSACVSLFAVSVTAERVSVSLGGNGGRR